MSGIRWRKPQGRNDWFAVALGLPLLVFSALALFHGVSSLFWTKSDGVISYSSAKSGYRTYEVDLKYRYSYAGREYSGDTYRFQFFLSRTTTHGAEVDAIQARYPVG